MCQINRKKCKKYKMKFKILLICKVVPLNSESLIIKYIVKIKKTYRNTMNISKI